MCADATWRFDFTVMTSDYFIKQHCLLSIHTHLVTMQIMFKDALFLLEIINMDFITNSKKRV